MATIWFSPPVFVTTERVGVSYRCNNVRGAAEHLLKWTQRGPKWHRASALCLSALEGEDVDLKEIRRAFEAAAKEAKMLASPEAWGTVILAMSRDANCFFELNYFKLA
ncbi:DUF982 domain-containing protein [Mesorhizobium sp.]|uniref:DUF982 domain-containing protein n=1 Tax=Mesorhizobium sp. TaxID=1871066 RepID=UPI000FE9CB91|nr:DUF982 domain-containing protein [Mesorhizobium sp.]RWA98200.1 MAG: DUF982 domain-containing protein [Mesorhizobium sp.]